MCEVPGRETEIQIGLGDNPINNMHVWLLERM